jgi:hypothetical protein
MAFLSVWGFDPDAGCLLQIYDLGQMFRLKRSRSKPSDHTCEEINTTLRRGLGVLFEFLYRRACVFLARLGFSIQDEEARLIVQRVPSQCSTRLRNPT